MKREFHRGHGEEIEVHRGRDLGIFKIFTTEHTKEHREELLSNDYTVPFKIVTE